MKSKNIEAFYLVVRVEVEHDADLSREEVSQALQSEVGYYFKMPDNDLGIRVESSEICGENENF